MKASYIYDAWGNHRVIDGMTGMDVTHDFTIGGVTTDVSRHIGNINPFRYRGYYFDRETGLYYLNSRYYDPAICRFINADDARVSEQYVYTLNGLNLYSYCLNNPITHTDENGHVIGWIIGIALALGGLLLSADALIKAISAYQRNSTGANLFQLIVSSIFFVIDFVLFIFSVIKLVQAIKAAKSFVSAAQAIQGADDAVVNSVDDIIESTADDGLYEVGRYCDIKGKEGLDAHHVGQKALMRKFIPDYNYNTAPAINVPSIGHTSSNHGAIQVVSRSRKGITNARQVIARDIMELRRVYPDIPNTKLLKFINRKIYVRSL